MNILDNIYFKALAENEKQLRFWDDYLEKLRNLNFNAFGDKLKVSALIPVGSRILFRGEIKHTNEITIALGADYFTKCSMKQAEILRQHRIKDAEAKLNIFRKERLHLENQLSFNKQNVFEEPGHDIIEVYNEEEDLEWRQKHRINMKLFKEKSKKEDINVVDKTDEELWDRLEELQLKEELELQEELENEKMTLQQDFNKSENIITIENDDLGTKQCIKHNTIAFSVDDSNSLQTSKFEIFQKVLDKQIELEEKLLDLQNKKREQCKTDSDICAKLDEIEQLEELEDEMHRLENVFDNSEESTSSEENVTRTTPTKKSVIFADEDESETLEITFNHSNVTANSSQYDKEQGIMKPSDIYEAHKLNIDGTKSILKKSKYDSDTKLEEQIIKPIEEGIPKLTRTVIVKDITENVSSSEKPLENKRTPSLFKKSRLQKQL